jgi:DNA helicase-2/ATP-dependent DNA helicase PcrA
MNLVDATTPTPDDEALIAEELAIHERVKEAVKKEALARSPELLDGYKAAVKELRDEAITASERDLPALFQQLYTQHSLAARTFDAKLPDMRAPYFARMRLVEAGKARDVLIGYQTFIDTDAGVTIIDWRHAVLAKLFFSYRQGDEYEPQLPGRIAHGNMAVRRVLTFEVGELIGVTMPEHALVRSRGGDWRRVRNAGVPQLVGGAGKAVNVNQFGAALSSRRLPDVSALLDPEQYEILNREDQGALLILGGAGSGKTTIALHRLALLSFRRPRFYQQRAMQVVVPEQGLVRLTQRLLKGLGMDDVRVETFDAWVADQAKNILKGIPRRICDAASSAVIYVKRHPATMAGVERFVELLAERFAERARFLFADHGDLVDGVLSAKGEPLLERYHAFETAMAARAGGDWAMTNLQNLMKEARATALNVEACRSELFTNPELLALIQARSDGRITGRMLGEVSRHVRKQFAERSLEHLDDDELKEQRAVDGAAIEQDEFSGTIDIEDYAVLLYFMLRVNGRVARKTKALSTYKHLVIDEAQDLAPIELALLGQARAEDGTMTVAGDAVQQSDATVVFEGWDQVMDRLAADADGIDEARLNTNYRCPRPIAEFGHKVLGAMAPAELPHSVREGGDVLFSTFPNEGLASVAITEALNALYERESQASVAIICESEENARAMYAGLQNVGDVRLVIDGEFSFKPGVDVTDVAQIKGLEFDYVIIPDANLGTYPDTPVARRTLHIAVTRAVHQLWVISVGRPTEII